MIYLDNSATTKVLEETCNLVNIYNMEKYFNASALYSGAVSVSKDISSARKTIADILGCGSDEIYFTSGGTEADNIAIFGSLRNNKGRIITTAGEHLAVYNCFSELKNKGYDVRFAKLDKSGQVDIEHYKSLLTDNTIFVSAIHAGNETGAVNDIKLICGYAKKANPLCIVHSDGVQAYLKTDVKMNNLNIDLYSVSGHKVHCPKGIGVLYIRKGVKVNPLFYGASQEYGIRPGTENAALICAFSKTSKKLYDNIIERTDYIYSLRQKFCSIISDKLKDFIYNGGEKTLCNIVSLGIAGIKSEILIQMLSDKGIFVGSGSACSSRQKVSRVLKELNVPPKYIEGAIRISFSHLNTMQETEIAAEEIVNTINTLRQMVK